MPSRTPDPRIKDVGQQGTDSHTGDMARDAARYQGKVGVGPDTESAVNLSRWVRGESQQRAAAIGRSSYGNDLRPEMEAKQQPSTDMRQPAGARKPAAKPVGPKPKKT